MPKVFTSKTQKIGELGENIAAKFLVKHSFIILERNYTKKWGELDIIAEKNNKLYFVEVKSIAQETLNDVIRETFESDKYRPEENMHPKKLQRMSKAIQTYIFSRKNAQNKEWQVDLLVVYLDLKNKKAKIKVVENIIL